MMGFAARRALIAAVTISLWFVVATLSASAEDANGAKSGIGRQQLIAIPDFRATSPKASEIAAAAAPLLRAKLQGLGSYAASDSIADINVSYDVAPAFSTWQSRHVDMLVVGQVLPAADGRLRLDVRVWNIPERRQAFGQVTVFPAELWNVAVGSVAVDIRASLASPADSGVADRDR